MKTGISRRRFLQNIGAGTVGAVLANVAFPASIAHASAAATVTTAQAAAATTPEVELLIGDVTGFSLTGDEWEGAFGWVTFQLHEAWYNGEPVYYIRTDASDQTYAADNHLLWVPLLNAAVAAEGSAGQLYIFENGADGQAPVVNAVPGDDAYSPLWQIHNVTFSGSPTVLDSVDAIREAEANGNVTIEASALYVNFPVVKWPGGELPVDTELNSYLGTGPLVSAPDTDAMRVTFKLHECYPGSRYIVTDTSAVPMAPMMSIAPSGPTQALAEAGGTDEIWVFGNGIPGSGVMGFQPAIFDNTAGSPAWSPFWFHLTAVWVDESQARVITSSAELRELIEAGDIEVFNGTPDTHPNGFVVNCPVPIRARNTFQDTH